METNRQWASLGVFDRWVATRWKEYSPAGGLIEIVFERTDERTVHLRVSSGGALMAEVVFRFEAPGQGRYCEVHDKVESCDAAFTYDQNSMTYLPNDPKKRVYRAVLTEPNVFVHYEEVRGVPFDMESYAEAAFDGDPAVRERAKASLARREQAVAEVKRRREQAASNTTPPAP